MVTCCENADLLALWHIMFSCFLSLSHMVSWSGVVLYSIDSLALFSSLRSLAGLTKNPSICTFGSCAIGMTMTHCLIFLLADIDGSLHM